MRHEGNKQGEYADMKRAQLGEEEYEAMRLRARDYYAQNDAILDCMVLLGAVEEPRGF